MRIGILTFHYAHNYGAVLQAYALKQYLISIGHDVKIINYRNKTIASNYTRILKSGIPLRSMIHRAAIKKELLFLRNYKYAAKSWKMQWERFEGFITENLNDMPVVKDMSNLDGVFDLLITGSDQVWSSALTGGIDRIYLLDIPFTGRKVSYAASIGCGYIPEAEKTVFEECLKSFYAISAREGSLVDSIQNELKIKSQTVLDPTLLLNKEQYILLSRKSTYTERIKPYVFAYFVCEDDKMHCTAKKIAEMQDIDIIELHYYNEKGSDLSYQRADLGPYEFLNLILYAEMVITNSFHGTVFSLLFEKRFYSFYKENSRIQNLLDTLEIPERHINCSEDADYEKTLDYSSIGKRIEKYRESSYEFLKEVTTWM